MAGILPSPLSPTPAAPCTPSREKVIHLQAKIQGRRDGLVEKVGAGEESKGWKTVAVLMPEKPACVKPPVRPMRAASPASVASPGVEAAEGSGFTLPGGPAPARPALDFRLHPRLLEDRQGQRGPTRC